MTDEVKEYAEKRIRESDICMVPGHYPDFEDREQVDLWLAVSKKMFEDNFNPEKIPEVRNVNIEYYKELLWRLKKNEEAVPMNVLRSKHKTAYENLRQELKEMTMAIMQEVAFDGLRIERSQAEGQFCRINMAIEQSGLLVLISKAVYQEKCFDKTMSLILELRRTVHGSEEPD